MPFTFQRRLPYIVLAAATLALDRWTKALIQKRFDLNESISVIDGFFNITYVRNTGVAFGIFDPLSLPAKSVLLSVFTAVAAVVVITYSVRSSLRNRLLQFALALVLGGALGNLYDRLAYGYVVDFLEFYVRTYHWPSFNVADSAISIGVSGHSVGCQAPPSKYRSKSTSRIKISPSSRSLPESLYTPGRAFVMEQLPMHYFFTLRICRMWVERAGPGSCTGSTRKLRVF